MDNDLQRQLRNLADEASPRPGSEDVVVKKARSKRRLAGGLAGLALVALIGGLAGATSLLGDRGGINPAPGPQETDGCVSVGYDLAVFVPGGATEEEVSELGVQLRAHEAVAGVDFVTAEEAEREFRAENPDYDGPLATTEKVDQYRLDLMSGVDPRSGGPIMKELANMGGRGASAPALECPPKEPQEKFARYFFEVAKSDESATGVMEVDWEEKSICLEADASPGIVASHLLDQRPDLPKGTQGEGPDPVVVVTFFELGESFGSFPSEAICLRDQEPDILRELLDDHERFAIDFHRGPEDEPGLVAELVPRDAKVRDGGKGGLEIELVAPESVAGGQQFDLLYRISDDEGKIRGVLIDWGDDRTWGGLPTDLVCTSVEGEQKPTEPSASEKQARPHAYRGAGVYEISVTAYSGGCFTRTEQATATVDIEVIGDAGQLNGPLRPRAKIGHAYYVDGDPSVLVSDIGGYDDDGFIQTIEIDWGDGHTETVDRPIEFCDPLGNAYPSGWFSTPMEHRYEEPGDYLVKVEVVSVGCDGLSAQMDSAERTLEFPPEQGS